jgi:tryptophanyl-tRNA synthetase
MLYRESDIPEITQLNCLLASVVPKSLLNQAHAYKAATARNRELGKCENDWDEGVSIGLFNYPLLMAADILAFDIDLVPVGKDQAQHVEIARDIARRFNVRFGEVLKMPQAVIEEETALVPGLDGRKMSKSYNNAIALFQPPRSMEKQINRIVTDALPADAPKDPETSTLFALYQGFATPEQIEDMRQRYAAGIGWGYVKKELFAAIQKRLADPYQRYLAWMNDLTALEKVLQKGAAEARSFASTVYSHVSQAVGL